MTDIDEKILEMNIKISNYSHGIYNGLHYDLEDVRDFDENLKEEALEQLEKLEEKLYEAFEILSDMILSYKTEEK